MALDKVEEKNLRIGIVGGGKRCKTILEMFQRQRPPMVNASVVIVVDPNSKAPGYQYAREVGIETTTDLEAFCERQDLHFILDLSGARETLVSLLVHKGSNIPVLDAVTSNLFYDVLNIQKELINTRRFLRTVLDSIKEDILVNCPER